MRDLEFEGSVLVGLAADPESVSQCQEYRSFLSALNVNKMFIYYDVIN